MAPRKKATDATRVEVVNDQNEKVGDRSLAADVFATPVNEHLLYEAVKQYRAGGRRGTHMTKNRALVSGSGKKPWRQKGTGRARVGETRNPLWRHGGTVFGPSPRDYSFNMPKKARAAAMRSALSQRLKDGGLKVVDEFTIAIPEERPFRLAQQLSAVLERLKIEGKAVIVDAKPSEALLLSGRNLANVRVVDESHLTVYDVLDCRHLVMTQDALGKLEERLAR